MKNIRNNSPVTLDIESDADGFSLLTERILLLEKEVAKLKETNKILLKERNDALDNLSKYREKTIKLKEEKRVLKKQKAKTLPFNYDFFNRNITK